MVEGSFTLRKIELKHIKAVLCQASATVIVILLTDEFNTFQ